MIDVQANAFLQHMVRNIAGVLMTIGAGEQPVAWCETILAARNRCVGGVTAPASGLYFIHAGYPDDADVQVSAKFLNDLLII